MATEWFYARGDQKHGPVSSAELGQLARSGKLLRTDLIWKEGMSQWRPAGESAKLFEGVTSPEPSPTNVASPPTESATAAFGDKAKAAAKWLGEKAKSAAQAAAAQAEIARLTQIALPSAYAAVGRHVIQSADIRKAFPDAVAVIDTLLAKLESLKTGAANRQPSTFAEKAKAVALATKELAESKAHELRLGQAYAELGRSVFEAGSFELPAELAGPIKDGLVRVDTLRKTAQMSVTQERRPWITKRRLLVGGGLLATVVCLSMLSRFTGRDTPTQASTTQPRDVEADRPASRPPTDNPSTTSAEVAKLPHIGTWTEEQAAILKRVLSQGTTKLYVSNASRSELFGIETEARMSDLEWVKSFPTLQRVVVKNQGGRDKGVPDYRYLHALPRLKSLEGASLSPADIVSLAEHCTQLETIVFRTAPGKPQPLEAYAKPLSTLKNLKYLIIKRDSSHASGEPDDVAPVSLGECANLEWLVFCGMRCIPGGEGVDYLLPHISKLKHLQILRLGNNSATPMRAEDYSALSGCISLKKLCLAEHAFARDPDAVFLSCREIPQLEYLAAGGKSPSDKALIEMREVKPKLRVDLDPTSRGVHNMWETRWRSLAEVCIPVVWKAGKLLSIPPDASRSSRETSGPPNESLGQLGHNKGVALAEAQIRVLKHMLREAPQVAHKHYHETTLPMKAQMAQELKEMASERNQAQVELLTGQISGFTETMAEMDERMQK